MLFASLICVLSVPLPILLMYLILMRLILYLFSNLNIGWNIANGKRYPHQHRNALIDWCSAPISEIADCSVFMFLLYDYWLYVFIIFTWYGLHLIFTDLNFGTKCWIELTKAWYETLDLSLLLSFVEYILYTHEYNMDIHTKPMEACF